MKRACCPVAESDVKDSSATITTAPESQLAFVAALLLISGKIHQLGQALFVGNLGFQNPTSTIGIFVEDFQRIWQSGIHFEHFTINGAVK